MKIFLQRLTVSGLFVVMGLMILTSCNTEKGDAVEEEKVIKAIDTANMDTSVKPGDNFFKYANGGWMRNNPIPDEFSRYGAFEVLLEENNEALKTMFVEASENTDAEKGSIDQKIGDFYSSGMDTAKIEAAGFDPVKDELAKIDAIETIEEIQDYTAYMHTMGAFPVFVMYAAQDQKNSDMVISNFHQGGLGLPDRDYYLSEDPRSEEMRMEYVKHIAKMFGLIGTDEEVSSKKAEIIMAIETRMAKASRTRVDLRDPESNYNGYDLKGLVELAPGFGWETYFKNIGLASPEPMNVGQPEFLQEISAMMSEVPVDDWKLYLKWNLLNEAANYLSDDFVNQNFEFYGKVLSGKEVIEARWKRVLKNTSNALGELVGQLFVKKYFPPEAKTKMLDLVKNLKASLGQRISNVDWMGEETKKKALEKLGTINVKIGYPDKWIDYSDLEIDRGSYFKNVMAASRFMYNYNLNKIGKPVDRDEWHMYPQTVNAYYSPTMNEIVFPAAILQPPFFNLNADDAVNYGSIGVVIGHEMTHGFDDQGRHYDKDGNLSEWWTKEDAEAFDKKVQVLVEQYNNYVMLDSMTINGDLTLGENIADLGGLTVSLNAYKIALEGKDQPEKIDGFTWQQRFFLSYASVWRQNIRDKELMRRLKEDVHSPGEFRTIGGVANIPEFYEAFEIDDKGKYFIPAEKRAIVW